jgi:tRNA (guanine26-N2/guanine27-N2)-dimethyltransferase
MGGPIWAGPLHSLTFLQRLSTWHGLERLGTAKRLQGVLAVMEEELIDVPLYYTVDRVCSILHLESIPMLTLR